MHLAHGPQNVPPTNVRSELCLFPTLPDGCRWVAARKGCAYSMVEARQCRCTEVTRGPVQLQVNADGSIPSGVTPRKVHLGTNIQEKGQLTPELTF